ncbi:regulator of chromosome condensation 1/beta-lactamase-inhibitor protein II [Phlebopus sp. FC_14]|nr:regulator of chromosome condensation 1/beta-lactamase-inhibitor protein II [Phlebopus sp. FC_14]
MITADCRPNTLLAAGSNARGQLGIGSCEDTHVFAPCTFAGSTSNQLPPQTHRILNLVSGANHTVLLLQRHDGSTDLWGCGDGSKGQLGHELYESSRRDTEPGFVFTQLAMPLHTTCTHRGYTYRLIAAAWETTYIVLSCDTGSDVLISMGGNDFGALGVGGGENGSGSAPNMPRVVNVEALLSNSNKQSVDGQILRIKSLHAGPRHVVVQLQTISAEGMLSSPILVGWGASRHGQLGHKTQAPFSSYPIIIPVDIASDGMVSCALGNQHTVILHESGRVSALGSNKKGQLRVLQSPYIREIECTWNGTYMRVSDGGKDVLWSTGSNAKGQLGRGQASESISEKVAPVQLPAGHIGTIGALACGSEHVLILASGSSERRQGPVVLGWGWNEHGNLGLGSLVDVSSPTRIWSENNAHSSSKVHYIWAGCGTSWLLVS